MLAPLKQMLQYPKSTTEITNLRVSFCVTPGIKKASVNGK